MAALCCKLTTFQMGTVDPSLTSSIMPSNPKHANMPNMPAPTSSGLAAARRRLGPECPTNPTTSPHELHKSAVLRDGVAHGRYASTPATPIAWQPLCAGVTGFVHRNLGAQNPGMGVQRPTSTDTHNCDTNR